MMSIRFSGIYTASFLIILLTNIVLNVNYTSLTIIGHGVPAYAFGGFQLSRIGPTTSPSTGNPDGNSPQISSLSDPPDPPRIAHASCGGTLASGGVPTSGLFNSGTITLGDIVVTGNLTITGSGTLFTAHKIIVQGTGLLEVTGQATLRISQDSQMKGGVALMGSANLTMNTSIFSATGFDTCILMNSTSSAHVTNSNLYLPTPSLSMVLSGNSAAIIDRGSSLGTLELKGYSTAQIDSKKLSANTIHVGPIIRDHSQAAVLGSNVTPTLVFNGTNTATISNVVALHAFGNGTGEKRALSPSNLPVSWSLNVTTSAVAAWNLVSEEQATVILANSMATGNITSPLNLESFNTANTTLLAYSNVGNIYGFNSSTLQMAEAPGNLIATAGVPSLQLFDNAHLTLQYIHQYSIGQVVATGSSQVSYLNSPANDTFFQVSGNAKFILQNSTAIYPDKLTLSGFAVFLAQNSKVLSTSSRPAKVVIGSSVIATFTNTRIEQIMTQDSAKVSITNPGTTLGEVETKGSSHLTVNSTNILRASTATDYSHLTITNASVPDIDALASAMLAISISPVGTITDNDQAQVTLTNSNIGTLLVCVISCPHLSSQAPNSTVSNSNLTSAIIVAQGVLNISNSSISAILVGGLIGTIAIADSNVTDISFNSGSSSPGDKATLALTGKINIQALKVSNVPKLIIEGVFHWNIDRTNVGDIITISGSSTVYRVFPLRYVAAIGGSPLPRMKPYISSFPSPCNTPNPNLFNAQGCPFYDMTFGSNDQGHILFTVPFTSDNIDSLLVLKTQVCCNGANAPVVGIRTGSGDHNDTQVTIGFADDSVIAFMGTEVFVVPAIQLTLGFMMLSAILPSILRLNQRRKRA